MTELEVLARIRSATPRSDVYLTLEESAAIAIPEIWGYGMGMEGYYYGHRVFLADPHRAETPLPEVLRYWF